jgi:hypothetical protein
VEVLFLKKNNEFGSLVAFSEERGEERKWRQLANISIGHGRSLFSRSEM